MIHRKIPLPILPLAAALLMACGPPPYRPPPLTLAEQCAENGLMVGSTKAAEASGVVGQFFAGAGSTHSCQRPTTREQRCDVQASSQSAVTKQTYRAEEAQVLKYANDMRWYTYNTCMGQQPAATTTGIAPAASQASP